MKRAFLLLTIILIFQSVIFPQVTKTIVKETTTQIFEQKESFPISGSHFLREKEQKIRDYLDAHPEYRRLQKPTISPAEYIIGDTKDWWADSLIDNAGQYQVPSTCRVVGTNCYVFVEDAVWETDKVNQDAVDAIVEAFDNSTPADAPNNDGIYNVDTRVFGTPPDVDGDPKIIILILDIQDGWDGSGGYVAGYFYSANEYTDPAPWGARSNETEIFYMDCNPADLMTENGRFYVFGTTAHEFQHMIHWAHDDNELLFVNEGLSMIAEYICGYGLRSSGLYAQNTNVNLLLWDQTGDVLEDYSRAALWTLYMYEQFPIGIMKDFVDNSHPYPGWVSIGATIGAHDPSRNFFSVFEDWLLANHINDVTVDSKYGYTYAPIVKPTFKYSHIGVLDVSATIETIESYGAHYIEFSGGSNLTVTFTNVSGTIRIRAIKIGDNTNTIVEEVNNNTVYTPTEYGTTYNKVVFLIYNASPDLIANYTYSSTGTAVVGTMELAYEDGEPEGYLKFETGDSSAVFFSGITGAKLDSVKVAFRRNGRILMDISELDRQAFMRGTNLYGPVQVNSLDSTASTPYPVPYDNWVTVDLTNDNIDATNDFIVSFLIGGNPAEPGIMISSEPDDGVRNSRTYYKSDDAWYYITAQGTDPVEIYKYLIRAYVSFGGVTVAIDQTGIVAIPDDFSLEQNYPNPFNPSTTFRFSTPKDGLIKFTVHDLLGRVIYTENRNLFAGNYSFTWNGQNQLDQQVVSGVYFLRMEAEGFSQTRKMLMMK